MSDQQKIATAKEKETLRVAHREWKTVRKERQCKDYSYMFYWEQVTCCAAL
ncbi:MAG: hypothetical protein ACRBG0_17290 [Lewinella sp.]|jgi:hypothetical protein|uniref:hypothetical protein n=1 Tax=Lewinella sp. TaxID=2004506 RepID=UPI003D6BEF45